MHILNPKTDTSLLPRVIADVEKAEHNNGSLDIPNRVTPPKLQSIYNEVMRLYVDALVTRELKEDLTLRIDNGGRRVPLQKDSG